MTVRNRFTAVFGYDRNEETYEFLFVGDAAEFARLEAVIDDSDSIVMDKFYAIETDYGTMDIGGEGNDFLFGFCSIEIKGKKKIVVDLWREFFTNELGASITPTVVTKRG